MRTLSGIFQNINVSTEKLDEKVAGTPTESTSPKISLEQGKDTSSLLLGSKAGGNWKTNLMSKLSRTTSMPDMSSPASGKSNFSALRRMSMPSVPSGKSFFSKWGIGKAKVNSMPSDIGTIMRGTVHQASTKLSRDESAINSAMREWAQGGDNLNLSAKLDYFNKPAAQRNIKPGDLGPDGLRSGVTAMLNGMQKKECPISNELRQEAQELSTVVIFKTYEGHEFKLSDFGTPGIHGTGLIDSLNLSSSERTMIADRLANALHDLKQLGETYKNNSLETNLPGRRLDHRDRILAGSLPEAESPPAPTPESQTPLASSPAPSGRSRFGITTGASLRRSNANATRRHSEGNVAGGTRPNGARPMQAPSLTQQQIQQRQLYINNLFSKAKIYLTREELAGLKNDNDLLAMEEVINSRKELNAVGGEHLPAYNDTRPAQHGARVSNAPVSSASSDDVDMEELFANAKKYLTPEEFNRAASGEIDILDYRDIISNRAELNAPGGDHLPSYSGERLPEYRAPVSNAAVSTASSDDVDMEELFANAKKYLTPEEFNRAATGEIDILDYRNVINERAELNAPGGDHLPSYNSERLPGYRAPVSSTPVSTASSDDVDMEELFANARKYLTPEEFNRAASGEIDILDYRDIISNRAELNAPGGDHLPPYSA